MLSFEFFLAGVDIRSSKVCELGLLNYNAKIVFSSSEKRKFRCHYDYYWASVFKVILCPLRSNYRFLVCISCLLGVSVIPVIFRGQ